LLANMMLLMVSHRLANVDIHSSGLFYVGEGKCFASLPHHHPTHFPPPPFASPRHVLPSACVPPELQRRQKSKNV
jgi:hypothetical protein